MPAPVSEPTSAYRPRVLGIVPARGGSKGVPRKNIRLLRGKPLLAYAVESGLWADMVDRVICSTDDEEIADIARAAGAEVPFLRPSELAQDHSEDGPMFIHAVQWLEQHGWRPDLVVNLRPTSPLRTPAHVDAAIELLLETGADSVKSVCLARQHPHKMWLLPGGVSGVMEPYLKTSFRLERGPDVPRAQLEPVYWQNGIVDVARTDHLLATGSMIGGRIAGLVTNAEDSVDVDSLLDLALAEAILNARATGLR